MSDQVAVIARLSFRPDAVEEAEVALRKLVAAVVDEPGALSYTLHREGDTPTYWFYELYADQAAFDAHGQNPGLAEAFGAFGGLLAEPPELRMLTPVVGK